MTTSDTAGSRAPLDMREEARDDRGATPLAPFTGVLLVSFGGPEAPEEVMPFLRRVTGGRGVPEERLAAVAEHYFDRGGVSPINAETRALVEALTQELRSRGIDLPVRWGTRNATPSITDGLQELAGQGAHDVVALTTSAYPSYSSCRQYRENLHDALTEVPEISLALVRPYAHHPGFARAVLRAVRTELATLNPAYTRGGTRKATQDPTASADARAPRIVFVTHSIPQAMAETSGPPPHGTGAYADWHARLAGWVCDQLVSEGHQVAWDLTYCSRSGRPEQPWLEPDVNDHLEELAAQGVTQVVLVPIGFTSDHMEVVQDLDTEAAATAERLGLQARRAATVRTDPDFVSGLVDLLVERAAVARGEQVTPAVITGGRPGQAPCAAGCCPNLRDSDRPAACGQD